MLQIWISFQPCNPTHTNSPVLQDCRAGFRRVAWHWPLRKFCRALCGSQEEVVLGLHADWRGSGSSELWICYQAACRHSRQWEGRRRQGGWNWAREGSGKMGGAQEWRWIAASAVEPEIPISPPPAWEPYMGLLGSAPVISLMWIPQQLLGIDMGQGWKKGYLKELPTASLSTWSIAAVILALLHCDMGSPIMIGMLLGCKSHWTQWCQILGRHA